MLITSVLALLLSTAQPPAAEEAALPVEVILTNAKVGGSPKPESLADDGRLRRLLLDTRPEAIASWSAQQRWEADVYLRKQAQLRAASGPGTVAEAIAAGDEDAVIRLGGNMGDYLRASLAAVGDHGTRQRIQNSIDSSPPGYLEGPAPREHGMPGSMAELEQRLRGE